jgi:hypothetical protein
MDAIFILIKTLEVCEHPLQCKLEVQGKVTEEVMAFKYLVVEITSNDGLQSELKNKHIKLPDCLDA